MKKKEPTTTSALDDLQMLDTTTVAKLLAISRETLLRLYYSKELPGMLVGGRIRFPMEGIRRYIEEKLKTKPTKKTLKPRRANKGHSRVLKTTTTQS